MAKQSFLIAYKRGSGETVILADDSVPFPKQLEMRDKFASHVNDELESVRLVQAVDIKKPIKFITSTEAKSREEAASKARSEEEKQKAKSASAKTKTKTPKTT